MGQVKITTLRALTLLILLFLGREQDVTKFRDNHTAVNSPALSLTKETPHQPCLFLLNY